MADETQAQAQPQAQQTVTLNVLSQYVKDLSFENPNAPRSLQPRPDGAGPQINISFNTNAQAIGEHVYQVEMHLEGRATFGEEVAFAFDLTYGGVFQLGAVPAEHVHPVLMIECPRMLFPFARQILAEAVRNGGFPPLYLDPIDFAGLYAQQQQQQAAAAQPQAA